ncbi:MAG: diacylglycerol/lipid kinase family protein [Gemmatimonadaceae bacterium]
MIGVEGATAHTSPQRVLVILHGDRADLPEVQEMLAFASDSGCEVETAITIAAGDGATFAHDGAARGFDAIVAVGGDGTVNNVINGLIGSPVPVGIIPMGTANDFARQVGIPDSPRDAFEVILRHKPTCADTASLNGRRFLNVSTGGVAAEVTAETSTELKDMLGPLAYAITGVRKLSQLEPTAMRFNGPGFQLSCRCLLFAVGNARTTGGGSVLTPRASITDGLIDLCVVEDMPVTDLMPLLLKLRSGEHIGADGVHYVQLPELTIKAENAVSANVDGEPVSASHFDYRALARDLAIYLPYVPRTPLPPDSIL